MKDVFDKLTTLLTGLNIFKVISRYKGEFEEGADWNPIFPACYIRLTGVRPELIGSQGEVLKHRVSFSIYIADADRDEPAVLELIDAVAGIAEIDQNPVFLGNISWGGYAKGVEMYIIELETVV